MTVLGAELIPPRRLWRPAVPCWNRAFLPLGTEALLARFPALPIWTDALLGDTYHLTPAQFGVYMRMLLVAWRRPNCDLPNDDKYLAQISGDPRSWKKIKPVVMEFWTLNGDVLTQKRLSREHDFAAAKSQLARAAGKASALKRKETGSTDVAPPLQRNANPHTHTHDIRESDDSLIGKKNGKRLPDDWSLPDEWRQLAIKEGLPTDMVETEATKFANYWQAKSGNGATKRDWKKTWHNWILNAGKHGNGTGKKRSNLQAEYDAFAAVVRRL